MKRILSIALLIALSTLGVRAQSTILGGEVISPANMSHMDAAKFSQSEHSYMSARVAAMGGAYTSLGADLSSMYINPAGLGMYRTSALSMSLNFDHTRSTNNTVRSADKMSNLSFNQIGTAINLYQGSGTLVSFTMGFGYNKLADLNYRNRAAWGDGDVTIGEFFAEQMYGINPSVLGSSADPFRNQNIYIDEWGGVLGYQTYFIDPAMDSNNTFLGGYNVTGVPLENRVNSQLAVESFGSVGEYDFSMGFNIANILYLGTTLGIQDIEQTIYYNYLEEYVGASGEEELTYSLYSPCVANYGSGINFKIGAILRPFSALRLGVAYHTATLVNLTREYKTQLETSFGNGDTYLGESLINSYSYDYASPSKLLLGASVTIGNKAILSVDYDKVWYGKMDMNTDGLEEAFASDVENDLGTANNFRIGLEVLPIQNLYVRAGYAYYGSPLSRAAEKYHNDGNSFYGTYKTHTNNFSLGLGWRFATGSTLDLSWTSSRAHYTNSLMYYYSYIDEMNNVLVSGPTLDGLVHQSNAFGITYSLLF